MPPRQDSAARHQVEASAALERLFSEAPLPGLADPAWVEASGFRIGYKPFERLPVSGWSDEHRYLAGVGASEQGKWRTARTPYLREIMDNMSTGSPIWKQAFVAGAQIGKTEAGNCCLGYWIAAAPGPIMMVLPKAGTAEKMSKQRITPMINTSPKIAEKVTANLLFSKEFHGGVLFFASAQSATDLRAIPVRYLYCDEVDAFPIDCEGEGPPLNLAFARTRTFRNKRKIFLTSTPKEESSSAIWAAWLEGDMRLYHVPCPHCSDMIVLEFEGLRWEPGKPKTVYYECPSCRQPIKESEKTRMLAAGEWRPTRKDLESVPEGVRSYRLPSLYAPLGWYGWDEMAEKWEGVQGNPSKVAEFRNVDLGLPSVEVSETVDWETVWTRGSFGAEPYKLGHVPKGVLYLTAGIDVGKDHIEVGVWGWGRGRRRWLVDHFRLSGHIQLPEIWAQLAGALQATYSDSRGVQFGIVKALIDTGFVPAIVKPWIRTQNQSVVMGCDGLDHLDQAVRVDTQAEPVRGLPGKKSKVGALLIAGVGVSFLKAELMGLLTIPHPDVPDEVPEGWVHMPMPKDDGDAHGFGEEHAKQLVSERKVLERDQNGRLMKVRWDRVEGRRAEVLDCHNYARAAASLWGFDRFKDREWQRLEEKVEAAAAEIRSAQEAEARGAPVAVRPEAKVGVSSGRRPSVSSEVPARKASPQAQPRPSSFGVTTVGSAGRRVVPMPRALRDEG